MMVEYDEDAMIPLTFAAQFNYFDEIKPAKTDPEVERRMVDKFFNLPENDGKFTRDQCAAFIHDYVHVSNHYQVVEAQPQV